MTPRVTPEIAAEIVHDIDANGAEPTIELLRKMAQHAKPMVSGKPAVQPGRTMPQPPVDAPAVPMVQGPAVEPMAPAPEPSKPAPIPSGPGRCPRCDCQDQTAGSRPASHRCAACGHEWTPRKPRAPRQPKALKPTVVKPAPVKAASDRPIVQPTPEPGKRSLPTPVPTKPGRPDGTLAPKTLVADFVNRLPDGRELYVAVWSDDTTTTEIHAAKVA